MRTASHNGLVDGSDHDWKPVFEEQVNTETPAGIEPVTPSGCE